ncbi:hemin-degrading factor [Salipiger sp.]|uniref:hemin-degrading factor n=1 Tax=Salipiger sp. TaxID=2078585 RepID=UPI003A987BBF
MQRPAPSPLDIRNARLSDPKLRERDLARKLGISEAQLVAAHTGAGATRIAAHPDRLMPAAESLGEVMALTRNDSCVSEKVGVYADYHSGPHASMVLAEDIDLRIFPSWWVHAFAVEKETDAGLRRSLQVFDAAGDAVHKIHLRDGSDLDAWERIKADLATGDTADTLEVAPRQPTEAPKADPAKAEILRKEWARLTDTHQFLRLCSKLKMNRLGAYRLAGAPHVRALAPEAADDVLTRVRDTGIEFMMFVGNRGCIQIHSGPILTLRETGPWQNVLDPRFDLHLRRDHVAEVWAVEKPTQRGPALSVEAFDAEGGLIFQAFPIPKEGRDSREPWREIVTALPGLETVPA